MAGQVRLTWAMGWRLCSACSSAWAASWRSVASIISGLSSVSVCAALQHGERRALPAGLAGDRGLGQPSLPWLDHEMVRSEEHTSELQSHSDLVCRLLLEKKNYIIYHIRLSVSAVLM